MLFTLLTTLPPVVHIISTGLEIPLIAVTVQSSVSGSPTDTFTSVPFPSMPLSDSIVVICMSRTGSIK